MRATALLARASALRLALVGGGSARGSSLATAAWGAAAGTTCPRAAMGPASVETVRAAAAGGWAAGPGGPRASGARRFSGSSAARKDTCTVTFKDEKDGTVTTVEAPMGVSLLEVAHDNDVDLEGACEGSLACSTCHVVVEDADLFDAIPEADDDENDMLDLAFGLTDTSRLGCQVMTSPDLDGIVVRIPGATRNFAVDGFVPKPH